MILWMKALGYATILAAGLAFVALAGNAPKIPDASVSERLSRMNPGVASVMLEASMDQARADSARAARRAAFQAAWGALLAGVVFASVLLAIAEVLENQKRILAGMQPCPAEPTDSTK